MLPAKWLDDDSGRCLAGRTPGAEGAETLRHKGLESDTPLESRLIGADEAKPGTQANLSGKQTEARSFRRASFHALARMASVAT